MPACCGHSASDLSIPGLGLAPRMARRWRSWIPGGPGPAIPGTHKHRGVSKLLFNFLKNHVSQPNRTLQALPQALWPEEAGPHERVAANPRRTAPLHRASVRKGLRLEALSCTPPAAGKEGRPWVPGALSAKNARRYQTNVEMTMMTNRIRTVMDTQMAIKNFFFRAFFWLSRVILTCSCPRST